MYLQIDSIVIYLFFEFIAFVNQIHVLDMYAMYYFEIFSVSFKVFLRITYQIFYIACYKGSLYPFPLDWLYLPSAVHFVR